MAKLELKNVSKSFGQTEILQDINLTVSDSEFVVLVGPSGSGKSTILRIIAGLETPSSGEIYLEEKKINKLLPKDRNIAMVFQNYALYPHMSVKDNLAFPLKMAKLSSDKIQKNISEASELLGLNNHLLKKPGELSGGERQRVALGRAIIRKPKLFLMDEPLSNLDAKLRTQMRTELLKLHSSLQATVVYVTHDQIEALTMGDKIVVLNKGKVQQVDTPYNVYHHPANVFVAGFIGNQAMNFFDGKVHAKDNIEILGEKYQVNLPDVMFDKLSSTGCLNKDLVLGIRAEYLTLNETANTVSIQGIVDLIEMLGNDYLVYASTNNQPKKRFSLKLSHSCKFHQGMPVKCNVDIERIHFFDKSTGDLI